MDPAASLLDSPAVLRVVVVPTDFSGMAGRALPLALALAEHAGAEVHLVHAAEPGGTEAHEQEVRARLSATCMMYRYTLPGREPVAMRPVLLSAGPVGEAVGTYARQQGAGLVVMASHGRRAPTDGTWWSENAAHVVAEAFCPVLLVPPGAAARPEAVCTVPPAADGAMLQAWAAAVADGFGVSLGPCGQPSGVWVVESLAAADTAIAHAPAGVLVVPPVAMGDGAPPRMDAPTRITPGRR